MQVGEGTLCPVSKFRQVMPNTGSHPEVPVRVVCWAQQPPSCRGGWLTIRCLSGTESTSMAFKSGGSPCQTHGKLSYSKEYWPSGASPAWSARDRNSEEKRDLWAPYFLHTGGSQSTPCSNNMIHQFFKKQSISETRSTVPSTEPRTQENRGLGKHLQEVGTISSWHTLGTGGTGDTCPALPLF